MKTADFANQYIFSNLGIYNHYWDHYPDGSLMTDGGLAITSRDLAKIGQLYLNMGIWDDAQIVSQNWIKESTIRRVNFSDTTGYGYHWMQEIISINDQNYPVYFHPGYGGQILAVFPGEEMVVVIMAGNYETDSRTENFRIFEKYIIPSVENPGTP